MAQGRALQRSRVQTAVHLPYLVAVAELVPLDPQVARGLIAWPDREAGGVMEGLPDPDVALRAGNGGPHAGRLGEGASPRGGPAFVIGDRRDVEVHAGVGELSRGVDPGGRTEEIVRQGRRVHPEVQQRPAAELR